MKLGKYKHYKKGMYEVIGVARYSEDAEKEFVVYKMLYESDFPYGQMWVRDKELFVDEVEVDGQMVPRYKYVGD
ncbi:MAG: DUF1653 domain-containing protein [Lactobacillus sp.]|jgi:hypothetical protein|nr:DUF1653 domain-containing protein [Lactobacillus sp.]